MEHQGLPRATADVEIGGGPGGGVRLAQRREHSPSRLPAGRRGPQSCRCKDPDSADNLNNYEHGFSQRPRPRP